MRLGSIHKVETKRRWKAKYSVGKKISKTQKACSLLLREIFQAFHSLWLVSIFQMY